MRDLRVRLVQMAPALGDVGKNLDRHLDEISAARRARAKLVVFPELSLAGYFLNDLTDDVAMELDHARLRKLIAATRGLAAVFGFVERGRDHRLFNACAFVENRRIVAIHRKVYLPTYGIFDDGRYFAPGGRFDAFDASFGRAGILICEDAWHLSSSYLLFLQNVDMLIVPSASAGRGLTEKGDVSAQRSWAAVLEAQASLLQNYVLFCNRVGVEDGVTFAGGSRILDPFGAVIASVEGFGAGKATASLQNGAIRRARLFAPMRRDEKPEIVLGQLRRFVEET